MGGYQYRGTGDTMTEQQVNDHLKNVRTNIAQRQEGQPVIRPGRSEEEQRQPAAQAAVPKLRGAVRVEAFPEKSPYPFREVATDGGVWRLDPAEFKVRPESIRSSAWTWAKKNDLTAKVVIDNGQVFVQFKAGA